MQQKITKASVERAIREAQRTRAKVYLWDTEFRGFGLYASPKGSASWLFQHWIGGLGGKPRRMVFNDTRLCRQTMLAPQAERLRADVNNGVDILTRKERLRQEKLEAIHAPKLGDAVETYLRRNAKPGSYWVEVRRKFEREVIPAIGKDTTVATITRAEVRRLIEAKQDKGQHGSARYLFAVLTSILQVVRRARNMSGISVGGRDATEAIGRARQSTDRTEIKSFWNATTSDPIFGPFYRLLLLTAQRREEVSDMRWSELNLDAGVWTIAKERTKNKKEHIVHLSSQALAIIRAVPKSSQSPYSLLSPAKQVSGATGTRRRDSIRTWAIRSLGVCTT